jgi:sec-independent protein translocase protein TatB
VFDISFSELMVIAFVALVVIGPEKLPKVARTAGAFFGRLQRFVTQVKDEVNRESRFAELQNLQQEVQSSLQQGYQEIEQSILPATPPAIEVTAEPVAAPKKPRKPRQPEGVKGSSEAQPIEALPVVDAGSQAELFAVPVEEKKKTRRPRKAAQKDEDTTPVSEQKPLA